MRLLHSNGVFLVSSRYDDHALVYQTSESGREHLYQVPSRYHGKALSRHAAMKGKHNIEIMPILER